MLSSLSQVEFWKTALSNSRPSFGLCLDLDLVCDLATRGNRDACLWVVGVALFEPSFPAVSLACCWEKSKKERKKKKSCVMIYQLSCVLAFTSYKGSSANGATPAEFFS